MSKQRMRSVKNKRKPVGSQMSAEAEPGVLNHRECEVGNIGQGYSLGILIVFQLSGRFFKRMVVPEMSSTNLGEACGEIATCTAPRKSNCQHSH